MLEDMKPHIAELRTRLVNIVSTVIVMFFIAFFFYEPILEWMMRPLKEVLPEGSSMIATGVPEAFFTALKVSFFSAFIFSLPVIFWQIWLFVAPGLYANEKKFIVPFTFFATLMFLLGAAFAYYIVVPFGFEFLVNFGQTLVNVAPKINEYVSFFTKLMIGFGLSFELPVITFFLATIGLVTDQSLKNFFKYAVVFIFILSAILTPPDVITQTLMAGPMVLLYGVSILIAKMVNPEKPAEDEEETQKSEE
jgi:sec-independent protein translocase protein TatC